MGLFRHRPLFLVCSVCMLAAVAGFLLPAVGDIALAGLIAIGAVLYVPFRLWRRDRYRGILCMVASLLALLTLLQSSLCFHGEARTHLTDLEEETVLVEGVITERRGSGGFLTSYAMELSTVNGEMADGKALLTCHYVSDLQPGYAVEMEATVLSLDEAAGDGYDATALMGDGYMIGLLSESEDSVIITDEDAGGLAVKAGLLRRRLAARLNLLSEGAYGLPSALLLGDKSALSDAVRRDFARAGVSHLLAISGLHMTLLFGIFEGLLRLLRVHKRLRAVILSVCALGYLTLLGFPPSATRAVIMLGAVYLSALVSARADPLTSLGLAGAIILGVTPYAIADAGFWMSYLATLGLICLSPLVSNASASAIGDTASVWRRLRARGIKLLASLLVGVMAMSFTLFIVAVVIGEMGILSPVSTLLLTPLCGVILVTSLLALPLSGTVLGMLLGNLTELFSGWMAGLAAWMSEPSWAVVSLRNPAVAPLAFLMLAAVLVLLIVRLPRGRRWVTVLPLIVGWVAIGGVLTGDSLLTAGDMQVTYLQPSSQADMLVMVEGQDAVICDLSNGSLTAMSAAVRETEAQGATEVSVLMLTHYHSRTAGALTDMLAREKVRTLWCPAPADEEDYDHLLACMEKAEAAGVPVILYKTGEALRVFGTCEVVLETAEIARSVQPVLLLSVDAGDGERLVYCGSAVFESGLADTAANLVAQADTVIFGNHGPLPKAPFGEELELREDAQVVLSGEGDVAGWFVPDSVDGQAMWMGQWREVLILPDE